MQSGAAARMVLAFAWLLAVTGTPPPAFAGEAPPSRTRVAADDASSRAVAYWRVWLMLRPRVQDPAVPLQERIEALEAFLDNSPGAEWAEAPRFQAAQILVGLRQQAFEASAPPSEPAVEPPIPSPPLPAVSSRTPASRPAWDVARFDPEPPKLLYDVVSLAYSAPVGFDAGLARLRWSTFQMHVAAGGFDLNGLTTNYRFWAGLFGLGARFPFGAERRHEVGFLVFPLSVDFYQMPGSDDPWDRRQGIGLLHSRLYYRYDFDGVGLEAGVATPLVFGCEGVFDSAPPLMLTVGVAFGRTHAARR